ncbi:MAG: EF-hand domain-containing protein [Rhodobacteraceae bacterium]|uniref:EF-hand domain-containing protein n=1 Tax=Amaricoccus sp. B4 TaxID=3368557 RepID=UPI0013A70491|nr:EF-hand domain-containing protein [Paracoccaceae bacterium]
MKKLSFVAVSLAALCAVTSAAAGVAFPRADANGDGYVTYDEAKRVFPGMQEVTFLKADWNGDGKISAQEYPSLEALYRNTRSMGH